MSAFLCSTLHTLVVALSMGGDADPVKTARQLRRLNNYALRARYGVSPVALGADFPGGRADTLDDRISRAIERAREWIANHNAADISAAVSCFAYQCSEGDAENRPEWRILQTIRARAEFNAAGYPRSSVWAI